MLLTRISLSISVLFAVFSSLAVANEVEFLLTGQVSNSTTDALPVGTDFALTVNYDDSTSPSLGGENASYPDTIFGASLTAENGLQFGFVPPDAGSDRNVITLTKSNQSGDVVSMRFDVLSANDAFTGEASVNLSFPFPKSLLDSSELTSLEGILENPEFLNAEDVLGRDFPAFQLTDGTGFHVIANSSTLNVTLVPEPNSSTIGFIGFLLLFCRAKRRLSLQLANR